MPPSPRPGDMTGQDDTHRYPIRVGDRVLITAYGYGARLIDVGLLAEVIGSTRTRIRVRMTGTTPAAGGCDREVGDEFTVAGAVVAILDRSDPTSTRQEGNVRRRLDYASPTLDGTAPCLDCGRGEGDLVHLTGQHPHRAAAGETVSRA